MSGVSVEQTWEEFVTGYIRAGAEHFSGDGSASDNSPANEARAEWDGIEDFLSQNKPQLEPSGDDKVVLDRSYLDRFMARMRGEIGQRERPTLQDREEWVALRACLCDVLVKEDMACAGSILQLLASNVPPAPDDPLAAEALRYYAGRGTWKQGVSEAMKIVYSNLLRASESPGDFGGGWWGALDAVDQEGIVHAARFRALQRVENWVAHAVNALHYAGKMVDVPADIWQERDVPQALGETGEEVD